MPQNRELFLGQSDIIERVVRECAETIEAAIRKEVAARLDEAVEQALAARAATQPIKVPRFFKLPPGPPPDQKKRPGPPMECRVENCPTKSGGPRWEFFCGEHFRELSPEQRRQAVAQWRTRREQPSGARAPTAPASPGFLRRRHPDVAEPSDAADTETA